MELIAMVIKVFTETRIIPTVVENMGKQKKEKQSLAANVMKDKMRKAVKDGRIGTEINGKGRVGVQASVPRASVIRNHNHVTVEEKIGLQKERHGAGGMEMIREVK